ncbi:MAG: HAD family hydrolase [Planctomycetota bacterium]
MNKNQDEPATLPATDRQLFFVLDAFGTLIKPRTGVIDIYCRIGRQFGTRLSREQVVQRFREGRKKFFAPKSEDDQLISSDEIERGLWRDLVEFVFDDTGNVQELFEQLWHHFSLPENWTLYEDTRPFLERLNRSGRPFVIASNFDTRLNGIVEASADLSRAQFVYCSATVGYRKPSTGFYRFVESDMLDRFGPVELFMVGDDYENDVAAPGRAGWKATHLCRTKDAAMPVAGLMTDEESVSSLLDLPGL